MRLCAGRWFPVRSDVRDYIWRSEHSGTGNRLQGRYSANSRLRTSNPAADYQASIPGCSESDVGYAFAGYISALIGHQRARALAFGSEVGLLVGVVTVIASACTPFIEWTADHLPEKRMGVFGIGLILIGFTLQSVQYWVTLLDISVR